MDRIKTKASRATGRSELRCQTVIALASRPPDTTTMSHFQPLLLYDRSLFDSSPYYVQYLSSCSWLLHSALKVLEPSSSYSVLTPSPPFSPLFPLMPRSSHPSRPACIPLRAVRSGLPSTPKQPHHPLTRPGKSLGRSLYDLGQRFFLLDPLREPGEVRFACPGVDVDLWYPGSFSGRGMGVTKGVGQRGCDRLLECRWGEGRTRGRRKRLLD
jgi:hypothetical protein